MPQLNPAPWLMILIFSWLVLLTMVPPKVLSHVFPYSPAPQDAEKLQATSWTWTWH